MIRFAICDELAAAYAALRFDPRASTRYLLIPVETMVWQDEHPLGQSAAGCHLECNHLIYQLLQVRQAIWDSNAIPEHLLELWQDALALLPEWPGFQRLRIDDAIRAQIRRQADQGRALFQEVFDAARNKQIRLRGVAILPAGAPPPKLPPPEPPLPRLPSD